MNNLLAALKTKTTGSALSTDVGGRIYLDRAPDDATYPFVVIYIISSVKNKTFSEEYTETLIQFSLFSASKSATEITTMYGHLTALFDECSLTITGSTLVWMREDNLITSVEDITVGNATQHVKHWAVAYEIKTSLN